MKFQFHSGSVYPTEYHSQVYIRKIEQYFDLSINTRNTYYETLK